jgi:predicted PurR-regulated permease PerM
MARKKKKPSTPTQPASGGPAAPPSGADRPATSELPGPLRLLNADYSAVLRMRNVRWLIVIGVVVGALLFGWWLSAVFVPLLVALATAYILNPAVKKLERRGVSRRRAVLWVFLIVLLAGAAAGSWVVSSVVRDARAISEQLGKLLDDIEANQENWIAAWNEHVPEPIRVDPERATLSAVFDVAREHLTPRARDLESPEQAAARGALASARADLLAAFQRLDADNSLTLTSTEIGAERVAELDADRDGEVSIAEWLSHFGAALPPADGRKFAPEAREAAQGVFSVVSSGLVSLFAFLLFITLVPIYTWYFMIGYDRVVEGVRGYLPGAHRPRIERILGEIDEMLRAFFRGRVIVVGMVAAATTIVYLAFGVKYAVLLGLLAGLGVLVPYFSLVASWVPALLVMLVTGDSWAAIIAMSVCFHVIQALEQYVITPRLLGDALELHPVALLVGVFVMASLFGLFGALLAVPLTAIARTLGREFLLPYFKELAQEKPA